MDGKISKKGKEEPDRKDEIKYHDASNELNSDLDVKLSDNATSNSCSTGFQANFAELEFGSVVTEENSPK